MKLLQKSRLGIQLIFMALTALGFFINFKIVMMVIMASTFLMGVFFCGWICPYGTMQDLFSKLGSIIGFKKKKLPGAVQRVLKYSRYVILLVIMLITADFIFNVMSVDPRANFGTLLLGRSATASSIVVLVSFIAISMFFERPFCNYLCFEGAKYGLMSFFRPFRIKRNVQSCIECKKCDKVCAMNIEVSKEESVNSSLCINCMECISSCPVKNTLEFKPAKQKFRVTSLFPLIFIIFTIIQTVGHLGNNERTEHSAKIESELNVGGPELKQVEESVPDGVYTGEGIGFRGKIKVTVSVLDNLITDVVIISHSEDKKWFNRANRYIPPAIIESQSTDVDVVAGATFSSAGIIDAVKDALNE